MKDHDFRKDLERAKSLAFAPPADGKRRRIRRLSRLRRLLRSVRNPWLVVILATGIGLLYSEFRNLGVGFSPGGVTTSYQFKRCDIGSLPTCVIDGDSFLLNRHNIRIRDINAPELAARCAREAALAARATERLKTLLSDGPFTLLRSGRDENSAGDKLRVVMRDGQSLGGILIKEGLAREWDRRRELWCD